MVSFPPSNLNDERNVTLSLSEDMMHEADEGLYVLATTIMASNDPVDRQNSFVNNGIAIITIVDNDGKHPARVILILHNTSI